MSLWSARKIFAIMLAVLVTAGLSLSVAQASDMAVKMSMGAEMAASGHGDCHACDGAAKAKAASCAAICAPVFATLPQSAPMDVVEITTIVPLPEDELLRGGKPPPDRHPPRTSDLS